MFLDSNELGDERKKKLWRCRTWFDDHATWMVKAPR